MPGPGAYDFKEKAIEGPKYGMGNKLSQKNYNVTPGPG